MGLTSDGIVHNQSRGSTSNFKIPSHKIILVTSYSSFHCKRMLIMLIINQQDPRPPTTDTSNTRWETVGDIGGGLMFTACNLLILSNWLSPFKSEPPPPPWILTVILPWEAHQQPLALFLWGEFHTPSPIFLVTGVWWLKCTEKGAAPLKGNDLVSCRPGSDGQQVQVPSGGL